MRKLFILSFTMFLSSKFFAQQTPTAAIKFIINTMMYAMRNGDSTLLRSVIDTNMVLQKVNIDNMGKVTLSTKSANDLVTEIGTAHADPYDERIFFGGITIDGPLANAWTPYELYRGTTFSNCGVNFFQLARSENGWKIIHIAYTTRNDDCIQELLSRASEKPDYLTTQ